MRFIFILAYDFMHRINHAQEPLGSPSHRMYLHTQCTRMSARIFGISSKENTLPQIFYSARALTFQQAAIKRTSPPCT